MKNSILSIFKIGIGPSSSHTLGVMLIGNMFCKTLEEKDLICNINRIKVDLYGSLSLTGRGHLTDVAIILGLSGRLPETITSKEIEDIIANVTATNSLHVNNTHRISFIRDKDIVFNPTFLDLHENGVTIMQNPW